MRCFVTFPRRIAVTLARVTTTLGAEGPSRRGLQVQQTNATVAPGGRAPEARWRMGVLAWALWTLAMFGLIPIVWLDQLNASGIPFVVAILSASTVGAVLASRRPRHPVGWLLLTLGLSVTVDGIAAGYAYYGALARPGALPAAPLMAVYDVAGGLLVARVCIGFVLLLTPTGSLPSRRWRWWARLAVVAPVLYVAARALLPRPLSPPYQSVPSPF